MALSFMPKRSSDRTLMSDEHLITELRVTENQCVLFNPLTYVYVYIYIYIYIYIYLYIYIQTNDEE